MAIQNRDMHFSQQKDWIQWNSYGASASAVSTGVTIFVGGPVPYPYVLQSVQAVTMGSSGAPQLVFTIGRVIPGSGLTSIAVGISNLVIPNIAGTSFMAITGYSGLVATGSTLLVGEAGDIFIASTAVANTASQNLLINVVIEKIQDLVSYNGNTSF